jgi:hypothetical protein
MTELPSSWFYLVVSQPQVAQRSMKKGSNYTVKENKISGNGKRNRKICRKTYQERHIFLDGC